MLGRRRLLLVMSSLVAVAGACGTLEVPFVPIDGSGSGGALAGSGGGASSTGGRSSGGVTGTGGATIDTGGEGGLPGFGAAGGLGGAPGDFVLSAGSTIRSLAADDEYVYWIEYGTFDGLDNYQFDGALKRLDTDSGLVDLLADDLEGPVQLGITDAEVFLVLDRSTTIDPNGDRAIGRAPIAGGALELMDHPGGTEYSFMTSFEDLAYFGIQADEEWAIREYAPGDTGRSILPFSPNMPPGREIAVDAEYLYFKRGGFWRQTVDGDSEPEQLSTAQYSAFALQGERILATRGQAPMYLASMPLGGGAWSNILRLGEHYAAERLLVHGERFVVECSTESGAPYLLSGFWSQGDPQRFTLGPRRAWAATETELFIAHGSDLFRVQLD